MVITFLRHINWITMTICFSESSLDPFQCFAYLSISRNSCLFQVHNSSIFLARHVPKHIHLGSFLYSVSAFGKFDQPDTHFRHMHINLVGPCSYSGGYTYILTCIDQFSCWPEAMALVDISAKTIAYALIDWISCFSIPSRISSNRGWQFESSLF